MKVPRRCDLLRLTPAELAIRNAILAVEQLPAAIMLTEAVVLPPHQMIKIATFPTLSSIITAMPHLAGTIKREIAKEVNIWAEEVMTISKQDFVPVDTGNLRASGHVIPPDPAMEPMVVTLAFGGPSADYALEVHENLEVHHNVGQAKYLEAPFYERLPQLQPNINEAVNRAVGQVL